MTRYFFALAATILLVSCGSNKRMVSGLSGHMSGDMIYFYVADDGRMRLVDSAAIRDGRFDLDATGLPEGLMFAGTSSTNGGYFFLDGDMVKLTAAENADGMTEWRVEGSPGDRKYREFLDRRYVVTEKRTTDSLDNLFYIAREAGDKDEMARIKEESIVYYNRIDENERKFISETVAANRDNPFGAYLYYTYIFGRRDFPTAEDISLERKYVDGFGGRARATEYVSRMNDVLLRYENCAIGAIAPEISGADTTGNTLKLSDLRGNFVIVDFWDSYCHWCREETPYLLKAKERFADKNFRILGVSSDRDRERWLSAIHEDGSHWDHLILSDGAETLETYCIKGIPHIILVDPDGRIIHKNLRWDDHITVLNKYFQ